MRLGLLVGILAILAVGCSGRNTKTQYLLAERLWDEGKFEAATVEFDRVYKRDSKSVLGQRAIFRKAMTEYLFLNRYSAAIDSFRQVLEVTSEQNLIYECKLHVASILYESMQDYELASAHFRNLLDDKMFSKIYPRLRYQLGRSQFLLGRFEEAEKEFTTVVEQYKGSEEAEKAAFELAMIAYVKSPAGGAGQTNCNSIIEKVRNHQQNYPGSVYQSQLEFVEASCLAEREEFAQSYAFLEKIKKTYPSPGMIEWKIRKIRERQSPKGH